MRSTPWPWSGERIVVRSRPLGQRSALVVQNHRNALETQANDDAEADVVSGTFSLRTT